MVKSLRLKKKKKKKLCSFNLQLLHLNTITAHELTQRRFVQEVQLCVEGPDLGIFLLDDADDEVQQRLLPVRRFGVQQLRRVNRKPVRKKTDG